MDAYSSNNSHFIQLLPYRRRSQCGRSEHHDRPPNHDSNVRRNGISPKRGLLFITSHGQVYLLYSAPCQVGRRAMTVCWVGAEVSATIAHICQVFRSMFVQAAAHDHRSTNREFGWILTQTCFSTILVIIHSRNLGMVGIRAQSSYCLWTGLSTSSYAWRSL